MSQPWIDPNLFTLCILSIGGTTLGLFELLAPSSRRRWNRQQAVLFLAVVLVVTGLASAAAVFGQPPGIWLPPLGLLGVYSLCLALRSRTAGHLLAATISLVCHPHVQAVGLLTATVAASAWWVLAVVESPEQCESADLSKLVYDITSLRPRLDAVSPGLAHTDKGRVVALRLNHSPLVQDSSALFQRQTNMLHRQGLLEKVIRLNDYAPGGNCHGFVFTGGRYWLSCEEVDAILEDNNYTPIEVPDVGDVAVYRDRSDKVVHSGVVWASHGSTEVLIESKWGQLGCFLHPWDIHVYPDTHCTFYHSSRTGHLLAGLTSQPAVVTPHLPTGETDARSTLVSLASPVSAPHPLGVQRDGLSCARPGVIFRPGKPRSACIGYQARVSLAAPFLPLRGVDANSDPENVLP